MEVLTDRPEDRFVVGTVLHREGDDRPLTIATAEAVADGPGWRIRFREVTTRDGGRRPPRRLPRVGRPTRRGPRPRLVLLARGHRLRVRGIDGAELGTVKDIYRIGETEVFTVDGGPYGSFDLPAVRAFIRIFAPRRGEIVVDAESLDLRPRRSREPDPDRPKAPRRRTRSRAARRHGHATRDAPGP